MVHEKTESVRALIIFPLSEEGELILLTQGCTFIVGEEYGEALQLPEGTTRTMLLSWGRLTTNRSRILFSDGLELRDGLRFQACVLPWMSIYMRVGRSSQTR